MSLKEIRNIEFYNGSKEELLPGFSPEFPYIASKVELHKYMGRFVPWHWHKTVELFYMQSGALEYYTPKGKIVFPAGSGGLVNSNVLHMTKPQSISEPCVQLIHMLDTSFIAGTGSRIEQRYIMPITSSHLDLIALYPEEQASLLHTIYNSFQLSEHDFGYEMKLRAALSDIWLNLLTFSLPLLEKRVDGKRNDKIKSMMMYIQEHFAEKMTIAEIAASAYSSERECFRVFHDCLHTTPADYIKSYRLQAACQMLAKSQETITYISQSCGLGSSSYFGKVFREYIGCTPMEYRRKWQDNDM